ncbi:FimV/HubP family polar landmark protein [Vibrio breoganii]|uniref:FimV/HubP family polar landmark protein n=2 Tax=Vibrio breoganii TaxID=553239 RepID=UPI001F10AFE1|nr:FimV/HubP family polar landmark protein [Vibrio breoganii]
MRSQMELYRRTLIVIACILFSVVSHAEEIRLVGPSGKLQAVPTYIVPDNLDGTTLNRDQNRLSTQRTYGPTAIDETLWSIGQTVRTSEQQSVYKMVLAIYRANPTAFEDRNIHLLKPGSTITIPTDAEVEKQSVAEAVRLFKIHERKASYLAKVASENAPTQINVEDLGAREIQQNQIEFLQKQLQSSQSEYNSLQQNNQDLLKAIGTIRTDVVELKGQLDLESERRANVEKILIEQGNASGTTVSQDSTSLLTNVWVIVALSAAVTALIMLLIIRLTLSIRPVPQIGNEPSAPKALNPVPVARGDDEPEIENVEPVEAKKESATDESTQAESKHTESQQGTVNPLDKEFEQELDKILADKAESEHDESAEEDVNTAPQSNAEPEEVVHDEDLPEYGEKEALADARKEALELLAEDDTHSISESKPVDDEPAPQSLLGPESSLEPESQEINPTDDVVSQQAPVENEPSVEQKPHSPYKTIDEVIAEGDAEPTTNPDEEELDLRVGLDEFPDVIGKVELKDVDLEGEVASQLDLATVYIQMNDLNHASKLLKGVLEKGTQEEQQRAQQLLESIRS